MEELKREMTEMKREIAELKAWKAERMRQQITYPLDKASTDIIQKDVLIFKDSILYTRFNGIVIPYAHLVLCNNRPITFGASPDLRRVTVTAATDVITLANHGLENDDRVAFVSSNTLPAGITDGFGYYVISATTNTFKISTTSGGSAVDITDAGTGNHYVYYF